MDQFVSTFTNKIDAKGRVSVPAAFREILARDGGEGVFCYPSMHEQAIDAGGARLVRKIEGILEHLPPLSKERDGLARALFGKSDKMKVDQDGRVILPERLREIAGITDRVTFVGQGFKFQMWDAARFEAAHAQPGEEEDDLRKLLGAGGGLGRQSEGVRE